MNNWRLLLLAVVAVLQPIRSFTDQNLIDGRKECSDHRSNSFTQETRLYGNFRKTTPEDRRLNSQDIREVQRRSDARNNHIRFKERLTVEETERRGSPESAVRFSTETRFVRDQENLQRSVNARETKQTRDDQSRRIRESFSKNSLNRYERDALGSRRTRMSRDDTRISRDSNERVSLDARNVRDSEDFRRVSAYRETVADRRSRDVVRDETRRDSRIGTSRAESRLHHDNIRERWSLDRRVRDNKEENTRSRSLDSRINSVERDNHRTSLKTITERADERRQRDQNRESRDVTVATLRRSSERTSDDNRRNTRDAVERVDQSRRNIREYRSDERIEIQRQQRDESRLSLKSPERRESRLNAERSQTLSRESRHDVRSERVARSNDQTDTRRETTRDVLRVTGNNFEANERRQVSRASPMSETNNRIPSSSRNDDTRDERRQPSTRSLDRVRSNERVSRSAWNLERNDETTARYRRDVRSEERLDERREQRYETRLSGNRQNTMIRESRDIAERRQETRRTVSPSRIEISARSERESRLRERDIVRSDNRRDVRSEERLDERREHSHEVGVSRNRQNNMLREVRASKDIAERRQETRRTVSPSHIDINARSERESRLRERDIVRSDNRRDVRSEERLDERREHSHETRVSRNRQNNMLREVRASKDIAERRQETRRTVSPSHIDINARSERKSRLRERDIVRSDDRRDVRSEERLNERREHNYETRVSRNRQNTMIREIRDSRDSAERRQETRRTISPSRIELNARSERESRLRERDIVRSDNRRDVSAPLRRTERARTLENIRTERREVSERDESRALRDRVSMSRLSKERIERREVRDSRVDARSEIRNREVRMTEKSETRRQEVDSRGQDRVLQRQARDIAALSVERRSRDGDVRSDRLVRSRNDQRGAVRNDARVVESRRESKRVTEREVQPNRYNLAMERMDRTANRASRDIRIEAKLRSSDIVLAKDIRADTRREARDTRFRIFESKVHEIDSLDATDDNQNAISWQMVFYTLQGAYLCGFLMQMLTEKSNKGKSRNITGWWSSASKDLVKVD